MSQGYLRFMAVALFVLAAALVVLHFVNQRGGPAWPVTPCLAVVIGVASWRKANTPTQ
jgi:hypothetical protein